MLYFNKAKHAEASIIFKLINLAYRGETSRQGWTTEADILDGLRVTTKEISRIIKQDSSVVLPSFIIVGKKNDEIIATICCEKYNTEAHFGMIAVNPIAQNKGHGKALIKAAEKITFLEWRVKSFALDVISVRTELIAFYERLGYKQTGGFRTFPVNPLVWQPKVDGLKLVRLEKLID